MDEIPKGKSKHCYEVEAGSSEAAKLFIRLGAVKNLGIDPLFVKVEEIQQTGDLPRWKGCFISDTDNEHRPDIFNQY